MRIRKTILNELEQMSLIFKGNIVVLWIKFGFGFLSDLNNLQCDLFDENFREYVLV